MDKELLMGNQAIAMAALEAGVCFVSGYPGTPSTEILEAVAKMNDGSVHVEWSVNEKTAMEAAAGAAFCGARCLVTMKQVGLSVASDPLMCLAYVGVKGGFVVAVADDPGPISSQTEQDTRSFGMYSKIPVFDPSTPEEAYEMTKAAFALSEKNSVPVIVRPTTRVCHSTAAIAHGRAIPKPESIEFVKDSRLVIFPKLSYQNHIRLEKLREQLEEEFSSSPFNKCEGGGEKAIVCSGASYGYVKEALKLLGTDCSILKIGTPYPFPRELVLHFMEDKTQLLCAEELDPYCERELLRICGAAHIDIEISGKLSHHVPLAGELGIDIMVDIISSYLGVEKPQGSELPKVPELPVRPPVLCAGCPHRASFYAVKSAMKNKRCVFTGDIGCYTLGNAMPLDMVDTCLCMGAGIGAAQGIKTADKNAKPFAFIGDSTFFHSGITEIINAVYNKHDLTVVVLDNSTTAMTGQQPHPGTGKTMMNGFTKPQSIEKILEAVGVEPVISCNPFELEEAKNAVRKASEGKGVSAVVFRSPCAAVTKPEPPLSIKPESCTGCMRCIKELGCPAIRFSGKKAEIDNNLCTGCGLCSQLCAFKAIGGEENG